MEDHFDDFLKKQIAQSAMNAPDDHFTEGVMACLPKQPSAIISKKVIILCATAISLVLFLALNGFLNVSSLAIDIDITLNIAHITFVEAGIVLVTFIVVSLAMPLIEYREAGY